MRNEHTHRISQQHCPKCNAHFCNVAPVRNPEPAETQSLYNGGTKIKCMHACIHTNTHSCTITYTINTGVKDTRENRSLLWHISMYILFMLCGCRTSESDRFGRLSCHLAGDKHFYLRVNFEGLDFLRTHTSFIKIHLELPWLKQQKNDIYCLA